MSQARPSSPLGSLFKTGSGGTPLKSRKEYYEGGQIPWLMSGEVAQGEVWQVSNFITPAGLQNSSAKVFPPDTVLVAMYGATAGQVGILKIEATTNQAVCGILPNDRFVPEYIYYFLLSKKDELIGKAVGNAQPNISQAKIRETMVPIVGKVEQRRIVAILDEAFEAIAAAKTNTEKNLQNAKQLRAVGRDRIFLAISENCQRRGLGEVCGFVRGPFGGSLKKEVFVPDGFAVYEQSHAIYDQFDEIRYFVDEAKFKAMQRFELRPGDLIMSCSGTIGKVAIAPATMRPGIINQALLKLTPNRELNAEYLRYWMESSDFQDQLSPLSGGAAIQNVASVSVLKGISLPLPTVNAQKEAVELLERQADSAADLYAIAKAKLAALDDLKKSLLHQAFTGQLTAKSTDKQVAEVA